MTYKYLVAAVISFTACASGPQSSSSEERLKALATGLGDTIIRLEGANFITKYAPSLMPLVDTNGDTVVTLEEVMAVKVDEPTALALLVQVVSQIERRR
jgi:hypothetical protein